MSDPQHPMLLHILEAAGDVELDIVAATGRHTEYVGYRYNGRNPELRVSARRTAASHAVLELPIETTLGAFGDWEWIHIERYDSHNFEWHTSLEYRSAPDEAGHG